MKECVTTGVAELVILGTANTSKTEREVMDGGTIFTVPESLPSVGDEASTVVSFLGGVSFGVVFCWLLFNPSLDSVIKVSIK